MIYVGIDVAKDKHDCFITNDDGEVLHSVFTIKNNRDGFDELYRAITDTTKDLTLVKIGMEATGHYCCNLLEYLAKKDLITSVINPLHTNMYRRSLTLRKTKTDKIDASVIASMLRDDVVLSTYNSESLAQDELKSLVRYRFDKVQERSRLKTSVSRLICILFPELEELVPTIHMVSIYAMLLEYPGARYLSNAHIIRLTNLLKENSGGHYSREMAERLRTAARNSIGADIPAKSMELKHTIRLIQELNRQMSEIEFKIKELADARYSHIFTIPGINYNIGSLILAEVGDFRHFSTPDKLLAFAGLSPTTYQSGKMNTVHAHMEKRGSKYLRHGLFTATKLVCRYNENFALYLNKKRSEGKHYNVAISHAAKKLVKLMWHLEVSGEDFQPQTT